MTTDLYQKVLLVQHIPAIQGIAGIQNLIKSFAYRGDIVMELAKRFAARFIEVIQDIRKIEIEYHSFHSNHIIFLGEDIFCDNRDSTKRFDNTLLFKSKFCCVCGDYKKVIRIRMIDFLKKIKHKYPKCKCIT